MRLWLEENAKYRHISHSTEFSSPNCTWLTEGPLFYRHLLPGTEAVTSAVLPDWELFEYDKAEMDASLLLFAKGGTLADCPIVARLYVDRLLIAKHTIDPSIWESDIVQVIPLGKSVITHDQIMIVNIERQKHDGRDTIGILGCSFTIDPNV